MVPLSRAICCRPCLPKRLPPQLGGLHGHDNVTAAVAIVSIGCHKSAAQGQSMAALEVTAFMSRGLAVCVSPRSPAEPVEKVDSNTELQ